MVNLLSRAVTGANIIPTVLLCLVLIYWIIVIIGAIDIDSFDFDFDLPEGGISNPFYGFLAFLNVGELPFMLVLSIFSIIMWTISMIISILPIVSYGPINFILIIPNIVVSLFMTKVVTYPLKGFFKDTMRDTSSNVKIEGQLCTILGDITYGRLGQAEIERVGSSILLNVKLGDEDEPLKKGDKAIIVRKDVNNEYYIIKKFKGVR